MAIISNGITLETDLNSVKTNLTSLAMRQLRAKYSLVNMIVDEFTDTSGIDTSASNEDALVFDSGYFGCYGTHTTVTTFVVNGAETSVGTLQTLTTAFPGAANRTLVIEAWGARGGASSFSWKQTYDREDSTEEWVEYMHDDSARNRHVIMGNANISPHWPHKLYDEGKLGNGFGGGFAARLKGTFSNLQGGENLLICVGKTGNSAFNGHGPHSGGGGMSAVFLDHGSGNNWGQTRGSANSSRYTPLLVAGGGGGAGTRWGYAYNQTGKPWDGTRMYEADAESSSTNGASSALTNAHGSNHSAAAARVDGAGGAPYQPSSSYYPGGGGSGWNSPGGAGTTHAGNGAGGNHLSHSNVLYGGEGTGSYGDCSGGFGGGGSGNLNGGGGGGGFSGGSSAGAWSGEGCNGAGGGSLFGYTTAAGGGYNNTIGITVNTDVVAVLNANKTPAANQLDGHVIITQTSLVNAVNATLVSNATTATSTPSKATISIGYSNGAGTATINTDIKGYVSKDGGSNWVQATLVDKGSIGTYNLLTAIDEDVSDATSNQTDGGVAMKWKITTHNQASGKYQRLHSVALGWK